MPGKEIDGDAIMTEGEENGIFAAAFEKKHPMESNLPTTDNKKQRVDDEAQGNPQDQDNKAGSSNVAHVANAMDYIIMEPQSETFTAVSDVTMSGSLEPQYHDPAKKKDDSQSTQANVTAAPSEVNRTECFSSQERGGDQDLGGVGEPPLPANTYSASIPVTTFSAASSQQSIPKRKKATQDVGFLPARFGCLGWILPLLLVVAPELCIGLKAAVAPKTRLHPHIIPPAHYGMSGDVSNVPLANITLRDVLRNPEGFHLGLAPAFFGFYGYFGMLAAWEEQVDDTLLQDPSRLRSVAGASAGAMAAVLVAAGVRPRRAADFCANLTLSQFADPPGILGAFRGDKFEQIMQDFLRDESPNHSLLLQDGIIPVAVSGFDLQTWSRKILRRGSMARAARASASFPLLFQPVHWKDDGDASENYVLIDGGIADCAGLHGLNGIEGDHFVINLVVGAPWDISLFDHAISVEDGTKFLTISMQNLPGCGPWAMSKGPIAVDAASKAMTDALDVPLYIGKADNHYALHIDASSYW